MKGCVNMAMGSKAAVNTPAKAKYGPKGKACPLAKLPRKRITKATSTAESEDINTTPGNANQPNHAPKAAKSL
jgi:hypothetical protein